MNADESSETTRLARELEEVLEGIARRSRAEPDLAAAHVLRRPPSGGGRTAPTGAERRLWPKSGRGTGLTLAPVTGGDASLSRRTVADWAIGAELVKRSR